MKQGDDIKEKVIRLKYVRALEKFLRSNLSYLKDPTFDFQIFQSRVDKTYKILKEIEAVRLDSAYPIALQNYVNLILKVLHVGKLSSDEESAVLNNLLKEANLLDKEKNSTRYKKDKHKAQSFNDGY